NSRAREMRLKLALSVNQDNFGWIDIFRLRANLVAPAEKILGVVLAEMCEGREPLVRSVGIEDDLDQTQKTVIFDDEFNFGWHEYETLSARSFEAQDARCAHLEL